ncbi:hypothetical protein [Actinomyces procaprae]|uniref:hypothetical protein n=1 Tax=Actinomyces procaprae TaxID=2560010 RepID=UPI00109E1BBC|nr:hypothetical protein [Actinomyces procaprae]
MSGVLRIELRRSLLVRVTPLAAVGLAALMRSDRHQWQGVWPEASAAITAPLYYLIVALAGAAAWEVRRRRGERESRSDGESWAGPLLTAYLLSGAGVIAVGDACAVVVNLSASAPVGFLWPSYLIGLFRFVGVVVGVGAAVGVVVVGLVRLLSVGGAGLR